MERLTEKTVGCFEYALKDHKAVPGEFGTYEAFFDYSMAVKRLGQYEETGMEPEEIKEHEAAKYNAGYYHGDEDRCRWIEKELGPIDHLRDLLQAENDGRLVVLPCKVGDAVYSLSYSRGAQKHFVAERKVEEILYCSNRGVRPWIICCFGGWRFDNCDIGKTVFLTREEAEAALAQKGGTHEADSV